MKNKNGPRRGLRGVLLLAILFVGACATASRTVPGPTDLAYFSPDGPDPLLAAKAPIFLVDRPEKPVNRIGRPVAHWAPKGKLDVSVDPSRPVIFTQRRSFETQRGRYVNLIYRVHFERVPFSLFPFHIAAGRNPGLLVILTLDDRERTVLVTTVHTCGCYLAFVPTSYLPEKAYPAGWPEEQQKVWGEVLPVRLSFPENPGVENRVTVSLRDETHRVMDLFVTGPSALEDAGVARKSIEFVPMEELERIPVDGGGVTSFYERDGLRTGYVKGSYKPFETLFVSWWAWSLYVGADKDYGPRDATGNSFYTSLKFWNRTASDMGDFPAFLRFWGWGL